MSNIYKAITAFFLILASLNLHASAASNDTVLTMDAWHGLQVTFSNFMGAAFTVNLPNFGRLPIDSLFDLPDGWEEVPADAADDARVSEVKLAIFGTSLALVVSYEVDGSEIDYFCIIAVQDSGKYRFLSSRTHFS